MARRPKRRKRIEGFVFTRDETIPEARPGGAIAGARATKTSILSLRVGWMERVAKAWAVPCEKPM